MMRQVVSLTFRIRPIFVFSRGFWVPARSANENRAALENDVRYLSVEAIVSQRNWGFYPALFF